MPQVTDSCTYNYSLDISNDRYDSEITLKYDMLGDQTNLPIRHVLVDLLYSEIQVRVKYSEYLPIRFLGKLLCKYYIYNFT